MTGEMSGQMSGGVSGATTDGMSDGMSGEAIGDRHSAIVGSRAGRALVLAGMLVASVWIVGPNIPAGPFRSQVDSLWRPADRLGLVQDWGVFSPNPRDQSIDVQARLEYDDGVTVTWDVPEFDPVLGAYRQYRWNKWQERVRLDDRSDLWEPTAIWIADHNRRDGAAPHTVTLIRRWIDHAPLGASGESGDGTVDSDWNVYEFYIWERDS